MASASSTSVSSCASADVRHDEAAPGRRGDAEVDVVVLDDLAGRVIPFRVETGRARERQADGLRGDGHDPDLVVLRAPGRP